MVMNIFRLAGDMVKSFTMHLLSKEYVDSPSKFCYILHENAKVSFR